MAETSDCWSYSEWKVGWKYNKHTKCYVKLNYAKFTPLPPPHVTKVKANKKLIIVTKEVESVKLKSTCKKEKVADRGIIDVFGTPANKVIVKQEKEVSQTPSKQKRERTPPLPESNTLDAQ